MKTSFSITLCTLNKPFYPKRIRIPVVIKYNAVNKTDTMSNTQTKTKKMHVASVTLTNNNESNEKQMLKKKW